MRRVLFSIWTWFEFLSMSVLMVPVMGSAALLHRAKDPGRRVRGQWMRRYGRWCSALTPLWHFRTEGEAPADFGTKAYVVISNHESNADPFLLCALHMDMRWVAKEEIFKLPLLGALMRFGGDIKLRRGDAGSVKQMFDECKSTLGAGVSVMLFPEGTRSKTPELLPFKDGAFKLALEAGVDVLPLALAGTRDCMPKGQGWMGDAHAVVRVLEPIRTQGHTVESLKQLAFERISGAVKELRVSVAAQNGAVSSPALVGSQVTQ